MIDILYNNLLPIAFCAVAFLLMIVAYINGYEHGMTAMAVQRGTQYAHDWNPAKGDSQDGYYFFNQDYPNPTKVARIHGVDVFVMRCVPSSYRPGMHFCMQHDGKSVYISLILPETNIAQSD